MNMRGSCSWATPWVQLPLCCLPSMRHACTPSRLRQAHRLMLLHMHLLVATIHLRMQLLPVSRSAHCLDTYVHGCSCHLAEKHHHATVAEACKGLKSCNAQVDLSTSSIRPGRDIGWLRALKDNALAAVDASQAEITVHSSNWQHDLDQVCSAAAVRPKGASTAVNMTQGALPRPRYGCVGSCSKLNVSRPCAGSDAARRESAA